MKTAFLVFSNSIIKIGYDKPTQTLYVRDESLNGGKSYTYSYKPVSKTTFDHIRGGNTDLLEVVEKNLTPQLASAPQKTKWYQMPMDGVRMYEVNSSTINAVGYDTAEGVLYVDFIGGGVYQYSNVPLNYWRALENADSKGSWVHWFLKINDSEFPYKKVTGANLIYTNESTPIPGTPHEEGYMTGFQIEEKQK